MSAPASQDGTAGDPGGKRVSDRGRHGRHAGGCVEKEEETFKGNGNGSFSSGGCSFCGEYKYTGGMGEASREGYGTYKTALLDALSRFQKEAYRAYLIENLEMQRM